MSRPENDEAPTVASGQGFQEDTRNDNPDSHVAPRAGQALQAIKGHRKAFEELRAAAAFKGIAVYELANGEVLVCKWNLSRAVPVDALAAFLAPMGVHHA